ADGGHRLRMLNDKYRNIDREGSRRAFDRADCVGDKHTVGSRMCERGVGDYKSSACISEIVRSIRDIRSIESPLIGQRAAAERLDTKGEVAERIAPGRAVG